MRFKGTLVLLIVVLALGGFIYFYEIKGGAQREKAKESESLIWKIEDRNIRQIELSSPGQHVAAARKDEKEWVLTAPQTLDADSQELDRLARSAVTLRRENIVEQNAADLAKFGLSPAQTSLKFKTKDGKDYAINFGNNNPTGSSAYASFPGQKVVFLVPAGAASAFSKKVDDLRNRSVLSFEQPEVQSLSVNNPKGVFELTKDKDDRWWFKGTEKRAADGPGVRGILSALSTGKIKEFFNDNTSDYTTLGLDKPFIDVSLTYGKHKAIKHFIIGLEKSRLKKKSAKPAAGEGKAAEQTSSEVYLAQDISRPDLFFVEKDLVDKLLKSPNDVRDKTLASMQRWDVDAIELTNTKGSFSFLKLNGEWFFGAAKKKAKWDAVNGILDAMEKPVKEWIDKPAPLKEYGLDKPAVHAVFKQGGRIIADCALGKSAKNGIYAHVKGDSSVKIADPEGLNVLDQGESGFVEAAAAANPKK
jgi:hypothetical protein